MNVYDFDNTIYQGDSTIDYTLFCIKKHPSLILKLPKLLVYFFKYRLKRISKESFKEALYDALVHVSDFPGNIVLFWDEHEKNIKQFYLNQKKEDDLIISASPEFLINEIGKRQGFQVIASKISMETGKHEDKINCHGKRKVERFYAQYPNGKIEKFYSDSFSDTPLAEIAQEAYLVSDNEIQPWNEYQDSFFSKIKKKIFDR